MSQGRRVPYGPRGSHMVQQSPIWSQKVQQSSTGSNQVLENPIEAKFYMGRPWMEPGNLALQK